MQIDQKTRKEQLMIAEQKAVELFALNIMKAGEHFFKNPMSTPFIPTWSRVKSAIPDYLKRLKEAINEDKDENFVIAKITNQDKAKITPNMNIF